MYLIENSNFLKHVVQTFLKTFSLKFYWNVLTKWIQIEFWIIQTRVHTNIWTTNLTNLICDANVDIVQNVAKKSRRYYTNRIQICQMLMMSQKYRNFETLMFVLLFLCHLIQFVSRFFEFYVLFVFELLISILVVFAKKMFPLKSYRNETKNWNAIVSWIIFKRNHWKFTSCIQAISFFDIDTIFDNVQDFVKSSRFHWIVWFLNQNMSNSNWKNRYLEKNWKNRNSKTMKILKTSRKLKKHVDELVNWT